MAPPQPTGAARPLSPHLQVYKPQLTTVLSITHRATGVVMSLGTALLLYWLVALAGGPESYATATAVLGSVLGRIILFGFTVAFCYHLCNGVRHLFWDAGVGFQMSAVYASGRAVVVVSLVMTIAIWAVALGGGN